MNCSLRVELAKGVRISCPRCELPVLGPKTRALVGVLALARGHPMSREQLASILWSEADSEASRQNLRQALSKIRKVLGLRAELLLNEEAYGLQLRDSVEVDLLERLRELRSGALPDQLRENPDAFSNAMNGLDHIDPAFASWISLKRRRMEQDVVDMLSHKLGELDAGDTRGFEIAQVLFRMEPTHEAAVRSLMLYHHLRGETATALDLYEALWTVLDENYDVLPSELTQDLVVRIKSAVDVPGSPSKPNLTAPQLALTETPLPQSLPSSMRSIADPAPAICVARFINSIDDGGLNKVIDGFRLELISALSRFREWRIIDSPDFRPVHYDKPTSLTYLMSGNCIDSSDHGKMIITFQDCATKQIVWSEQLSMGDTNWNRLKRRAIRRVALAMNIHLTEARINSLPAIVEADVQGRDAWLTGQALLLDWRPESEDRAEAIFRRLVAKNPSFGPAYVGLAQVINARHHIRPGTYRNRKDHLEALGHCNRAVSVDPLDSRAQLTLAWSYAMLGNWDLALSTFGIAFELNENDPWTLVSSALGFAYCGNSQMAHKLGDLLVEIGLGISPLQWAYHAGVKFMQRDYEGAVMASERGAGSTPYIAGWHAAALAHMGERAAAEEVFRTFLSETQSTWAGAKPPEDAEITKWLLHCYPIRGSADWVQLRDGLALAGGPVPESPVELRP